ncbi:hypothetical protein [Stenotrophomonas maltophilia]|uniref:hypothetical protein n=1 Tax=Stenotrophomonas maltophilia TaxID=40324 RepID=UPI0039F690F5
MKTWLLAVAGVMALAPLAACSTTHPPAPRVELPVAADQLGLHLDMDYAQARRMLLAAGWVAQPHDYEGRAPMDAHPELDCGNGLRSVCTVVYGKAGRTLFLTLEPQADDRLAVAAVDDLQDSAYAR